MDNRRSGGDRDYYGQHDRRRSRSRSPDHHRGRDYRDRGYDHRDRDRDRDREREYRGREYEGGGDLVERDRVKKDPTRTVIIHGLAPRTTEPTETGECRGFAFVEFYTVEYSSYFVNSFAGSRGDPNAAQVNFIVENRALTLDYVDDERNDRRSGGGSGVASCGGFSAASSDSRSVKSDWICGNCSYQNFARRGECHKCGSTKNDQCINITSDPFSDTVIASEKPSPILVAKGLSPVATEDQVIELFRQFALVKSANIVRDPVSGVSRGIVLVEFFSVDYASHTLAHSADLQFERRPLKVQYAKDSFVTAVFTQQQQYAMQNAYAAAALQAAQWSQPIQPSYPAGADSKVVYPTQSYQQLPVPPSAAIQKVKSIWPPSFDTHGGAYSFQTASGCFFESSTGFYYCPKSKLYYNSSDGVYYRHTPLLTPQFTQFVPPLPVAEVTTVEPSSSSGAVDAANSAARKPVSMSLGSQVNKAKPAAKIFRAPSDDDSDFVIVNNVPSQHLPGSKKSTVDDSRKREETLKHGTAKHPSVPASSSQVPSSISAMGYPCQLCKRKFESAELLARHEKESKLHADNLKLLQQLQESGEQKEPSGPVYKDRAAERRAIYGQGDPILYKRDELDSRDRKRDRDARDRDVGSYYGNSAAHPTNPAHVYEDESNPGNQMLRKMGWQEGDGLGKDKDGHRDPIALEGTRIGTDKSGVGNSQFITPPIDYHDRDGYKESLLRAAKARYDNCK